MFWPATLSDCSGRRNPLEVLCVGLFGPPPAGRPLATPVQVQKLFFLLDPGCWGWADRTSISSRMTTVLSTAMNRKAETGSELILYLAKHLPAHRVHDAIEGVVRSVLFTDVAE